MNARMKKARQKRTDRTDSTIPKLLTRLDEQLEYTLTQQIPENLHREIKLAFDDPIQESPLWNLGDSVEAQLYSEKESKYG